MQKLTSPKLAWFSLSLFYMYVYMLRVFPSVAEHELRTDLLLSATDFATLGSLYLVAYGALQIPLGSIVGRLGLRKISITAISFCILGSFISFLANALWAVQLGRVLMGAGAAPIFMCSLKICSDYIPAGHRGVYMGITLTMGTFGALLTGNIIVSMLDALGWRISILILGGIGCVVVLLILLNIQNTPSPKSKELLNFPALRDVFSNKFVYIYGLLGLGFFSSLNVFTDLWGTAYLEKRFSISRIDAASASMLMYIGLAIGSLLLPWYFSTKTRVFIGIKLCATALFVLFFTFVYFEWLSFFASKLVLFLLGLFSGGIMLVFSAASFWTSKETSGLTISIINTFNMFGGAIINQCIGFILNYSWDGALDIHSVPQYSLSAQNLSFALTLGVLFAINLIVALYISRSRVVKKISRRTKA